MSELAESNISIVHDVFIKQIIFRKAGWIMQTHAHCYDHQTLVAAGRIRMTVDGLSTDHEAPTILTITAGCVHHLESLVDHTVAYCIHAIKNGETVDTADALVQGIDNADLHHLA